MKDVKTILVSKDKDGKMLIEGDVDATTYFDRCFAELSPEVVQKGSAILLQHLPEDAKEEVAKRYAQFGKHAWIYEDMAHFGFGMGVRNLLREQGLTDDMLPNGNWDDYYVSLIEHALKLSQ